MQGFTRSPSRWLLLLVTLAMLATACGGGDGGTEPDGDATETEQAQGEPVDGGTVTFGQDQEPAILMEWFNEGNLQATSIPMKAVLYPLWRITPEFSYEPLLLDGEPEVTEDPFTVTYKLKDEAVWSDGTPITVDDIEFTLDVVLNPDLDIVSRDGYDKIDRGQTERIDDKTIKYTFTETYAAYREMFSTQPILPAHALEGQDIATAMNDSVPVASGPFEFESWTKGQNITLVRNENYWGEQKPRLDRVVFRFIEDSNSQVQALRGDEIDMFYPQPQLELVEQVSELDGVTYEVSAGPVWEHLDFNFAVPPMDQTFVRQAIIQGIDRQALAQELIAPMYPEATVLQNVIWMNNQEPYEEHWDRWEYDPEAAIALLEENGCTRGDDEIFTCDGQRLSFEYVTTAGNELRELQFEIIQSQLQEIGIEARPKLQDAATAFGTTLIAGKEGAWGMFNFAWVGSPDPASGNTIWMCGGGQNYNSYCNEEVTRLIEATNATIDQQERADLYNQADELMAADVPLVPLYQKPTFFAWRSALVGMQDNPTQWGPTWNIEEWARTDAA
ncbi:MAG TPA: peptide ABC transporter substrate-binding protein [Egibacteraceae bacterium]|nr:peptide ABC transporter substrate-binding protein [Egibacteraceae bacterium]